MWLIIKNKGEIERAALTLMGASSKDGAQIGFFGTGNKYALAVLMRNNIKVRIFSGITEIQISTEEVSFRGESYSTICVDGKATSLTTRVGVDWKIWHAIRELISNAMDEGDFSYSTEEEIALKEGTTTIAVDCDNSEVTEMIEHIEDYFVFDDSGAIAKNDRMAILPAPDGKLNIYRKAVSVLRREDVKPALFHYNFNELSVNEMRVNTSYMDLNNHIMDALTQLATKEIVETYCSRWEDENLYEHDLTGWYSSPSLWTLSNAWHEYLKDKPCARIDTRDKLAIEDRNRYTFLPGKLADRIQEVYPDIIFVEGTGNTGFEELPVSDDYVAFVTACIEDIEQKLFPGEARAFTAVKCGRFKFSDTIAMYTPKDRAILVSIDYVKAENKEFAYETLIEEISHSQGMYDGTRSFETFLCRKLAKEYCK